MMSTAAEAMQSNLTVARTKTSGAWIDGTEEQIGTPDAAGAYFKLAMATGDRDVVLGSLNILAHSRGWRTRWPGQGCPATS